MAKRVAQSLPDLFEAFSSEAPAAKLVPKARAAVASPVAEAVPEADDGPLAPSANWDPSEEQFLTDKQVGARYQVSRASVWRWASVYPDFPKPHQITPGTSRWYLSELREREAAIARAKARPAK